MSTQTDAEKLKEMLREDDYPMLSDTMIDNLLEKHKDLETAAYYGAILKAEETSLKLTGMSTPETRKYFLTLAQMYKPSNSGVLGSG